MYKWMNIALKGTCREDCDSPHCFYLLLTLSHCLKVSLDRTADHTISFSLLNWHNYVSLSVPPTVPTGNVYSSKLQKNLTTATYFGGEQPRDCTRIQPLLHLCSAILRLDFILKLITSCFQDNRYTSRNCMLTPSRRKGEEIKENNNHIYFLFLPRNPEGPFRSH